MVAHGGSTVCCMFVSLVERLESKLSQYTVSHTNIISGVEDIEGSH